MRWRTKINFSDYIVFHWLLSFSENNILFNVRTNRVHETYFLSKVRTDSIPNSSSFVSLATVYLEPLMGWILRPQPLPAMLYIHVTVFTFWMSYAMLVEASFLNKLLRNIFQMNFT